MRFLIAFVLFIGRVCIGALFIGAALSKVMSFDQTSQYMASKGFVAIPLFLVGAVLVEFFGGLALVLGYKTRLGAAILLLFVIPTTYIFHDFWNLTGADQELERIMFFKNLAIFGGLLYVLCHGAGSFSFDSCCRRYISPSKVKLNEPNPPPVIIPPVQPPTIQNS